MVGMLRQAGVVDLLHLGMVGQIFYHLFCVFSVSLHPKGQGLHSLEKQKGIEGGNRCPSVPQEDGPDIGDKGGGAGGAHGPA